MTQEVVDRLLDPTQADLFTTEPPVPLFSGAIQDPQVDFEKQSIFKPVSKAAKVANILSASDKNTKNDPRITQGRFSRKHKFCTTFLKRPLL